MIIGLLKVLLTKFQSSLGLHALHQSAESQLCVK